MAPLVLLLLALAPADRLNELLASPEAERESIVSRWIEGGTPLVEGTAVTFLAESREGRAPFLVGDFNWWGRYPASRGIAGGKMEPIAGTRWHAAVMDVSPDARIEYGFAYGDETPLPDPANPRRVRTFGTERSLLEMDGFQPSPYIGAEAAREHRGSVTPLSDFGERKLHVYLPPRYPEDAPYPVVYFNDGTEYVEVVETPAILDAMIRDRAVRPLLGVFVAPIDRSAEYRGQGAFLDFVAKELVPFVDERYRTVPGAEGRAIAGGSRGALGALLLAFEREGTFGHCGMLAPAITPTDVLSRVFAEQARSFEVYLLGGTYDVRFIGDYHNALDTLRVKGYEVRARASSIGHSPGSWKHYIPEMLSGFFPP